MDVAALIEEHQVRFTPAERRTAAVVLDQPQLVAFGTVAELAKAASTSGASVIRLCTKLGFDGFSSLQDSVQRDLGRQLRPATARIRQPESGDLLSRALAVELDNAQGTMESVDRKRFELAVQALTGSTNRVFTLTGDASRGIGFQFTSDLSTLRPGVVQVTGSEVQVYRTLAELRPGRHGRVARPGPLRRMAPEGCRRGRGAQRHRDRPDRQRAVPVGPHRRRALRGPGQGHRPVRQLPRRAGPARARSVAGVADRLRASAIESLDRIEDAWSEAGVFIDE